MLVQFYFMQVSDFSYHHLPMYQVFLNIRFNDCISMGTLFLVIDSTILSSFCFEIGLFANRDNCLTKLRTVLSSEKSAFFTESAIFITSCGLMFAFCWILSKSPFCVLLTRSPSLFAMFIQNIICNVSEYVLGVHRIYSIINR